MYVDKNETNQSLSTIKQSFEDKIDILQNDFECLINLAKKMINKVKDEETNNDNKIKQLKKYETSESDIVKLNVGGTMFSTLKTTLTKKIKDKDGKLYLPNMFESLVDGFVKPKYDENKAIFIDRNPKYFGCILDYLRMANTDFEYELTSSIDKNELLKEAKFYNIQGLVGLIKDFCFDSIILKTEDEKKLRLANTDFEYELASSIDKNEVLKEAKFYNIQGLVDLIETYCFDSIILNTEGAKNNLTKICEFPPTIKPKLLYRATRDGFSAQNFHSRCDHAKKTLTIIKTTENYIFGGYTEQSWDGNGFYKNDPNAFIFSINNSIKAKINPAYHANAIYCHPNCGPTFGVGLDIHISNNSNSSNYSYSENHSYQNSSPLAGSREFNPSEIEVFSII